ncbi:MAG: alkaline phosphatase family protein [Bdellovibrionales bacterium]|nr:alkaline phosphatase family protein [Bdellovibrionales bacterium]
MKKTASWLMISSLVLGLSVAPGQRALASTPRIPKLPKLIVWIVIDQFRSDYLSRYSEQFGSGGFRKLMTQGAYFAQAQYDVLQAVTCVGHAVMATGASPARNGIPINRWYNRATQKREYCAEDERYEVVGVAPSEDKKKRDQGTSPKNLNATTITDEIKTAYPESRVVAFSQKDRGAILVAGHRADMAVWQDWDTGKWVSSNYYFKDKKLPQWLQSHNDGIGKTERKPEKWEPLPGGTGTYTPNTVFQKESFAGQKKGFPYEFKPGERAYALGPWNVKELFKVSRLALNEMKLGQNPKGVDVLAISVSTHDYVGHNFGPNSREVEEITRHEDLEISALLKEVDQKVGLKNTIVVLTADHGTPPNPDEVITHGSPAGKIPTDKWVEDAEKKLATKWGQTSQKSVHGHSGYIAFAEELNFFWNDAALSEKKISKSTADAALKALLLEKPEVADVITASEILERKLPLGLLGHQVQQSFIPTRSGDVIVNPKPNFMIGGDAVSHHTGYTYDRTVPIIFMGPSVKSGRYPGGDVMDIAPTLAFILGVIPPNSSEGRVLAEALTGRSGIN